MKLCFINLKTIILNSNIKTIFRKSRSVFFFYENCFLTFRESNYNFSIQPQKYYFFYIITKKNYAQITSLWVYLQSLLLPIIQRFLCPQSFSANSYSSLSKLKIPDPALLYLQLIFMFNHTPFQKLKLPFRNSSQIFSFQLVASCLKFISSLK